LRNAPSHAYTILFMRNAALSALLLGLIGGSLLPAKAPFTLDAMLRLARIDDPQLSPDGKVVAFTVQTVDLAKNAKLTNIYVVPVAEGTPQRITQEGTSNLRPRWSPDSKRIFYVSNRPNSSSAPETPQVWSMNPDGSDSRPVTNLPTGADGVTVSPDGGLILFTSDVYPACSPANAAPGVDYDPICNRTGLEQETANPLKARVYTSLLYRHWTSYQGQRRRHLMIQILNSTFKVRDLTRPRLPRGRRSRMCSLPIASRSHLSRIPTRISR
jgi:dipeptidyl aminopeptidase/acylaminoacyl peptidase